MAGWESAVSKKIVCGGLSTRGAGWTASSLKKVGPLVHLWFAQYHEGFWKATQVPAFHQNEQGLQWFVRLDVAENDDFPLFAELESQSFEGPG